MLLFGVTIPATVPQRSEIPEGLMNYPVLLNKIACRHLHIEAYTFSKINSLQNLLIPIYTILDYIHIRVYSLKRPKTLYAMYIYFKTIVACHFL